MSVKVQSWVWEHSAASGSDLLLLLAIADHAHDDGAGAYPSVARLAELTRMDARSVQRQIRHLVELGELEVQYQKGPKGVNLYVIHKGGWHLAGGVTSDAPRGDKSGPLGVTGVSPGTKYEPLENRVRAREADPEAEPIADFQANLSHLRELRKT